MQQITSAEKTFLDMIKKTCIDTCVANKITPSVVASLGIIISNWGTSKEFALTRNIYLLRTDNKWYGKCYSKDSGIIYDKVSDCKESGAILYRVYDDHRDSIKDFIYNLIESRRSENGPLRYASIIGCTDYKETVNRLVRHGFMQHYLNRVDDVEYISTIIAILEKYELFLWDDYLKG